ncbi:MAG: hypothetical protein QME75_09980 [Deltaproteobacteria bacterium]|nr:hypothetical protein [Deltaproteobacteria bacterium]
MDLVVIIYVGLLAYALIQKLRGRRIPWDSTGTEDVRAEEMRQEDKSEHIPAVKLVLQKESDYMPPESEETVALTFTDKDSFREEWETIVDDDAKDSS